MSQNAPLKKLNLAITNTLIKKIFIQQNNSNKRRVVCKIVQVNVEYDKKRGPTYKILIFMTFLDRLDLKE